jgi:RND superfamily putative drug exporter
MKRLATTVIRHPVRVVIVWLIAVFGFTALTSPIGVAQRADVMKDDQTAFLPDRYESVRAAQLEQRGFPQPKGATATIVLGRSDRAPLTAADVGSAGRLAGALESVSGVRDVAVDRSGLAPNRRVLLGAVLFDRTVFDPLLAHDVHALRSRASHTTPAGLVAGFTGSAPTQVDASERHGFTEQLTVIVIAVLLMVLFRSVVVALFDVLLVGLVGVTATAALVLAAKLFGFSLDTTATSLLPIVVLGVGTDYVVFLLHRYREGLRAGDEPPVAMRRAIAKIGPAIGFSALTVVVSLSALTPSSLASFRVLGPALGFGVLATLLAALTLVPAVAMLLRRRLFWPARVRPEAFDVARPRRIEQLVAGRPVPRSASRPTMTRRGPWRGRPRSARSRTSSAVSPRARCIPRRCCCVATRACASPPRTSSRSLARCVPRGASARSRPRRSRPTGGPPALTRCSRDRRSPAWP